MNLVMDIETLTSDAVEFLREIVAIPSISFREGDVSAFIVWKLQEWGLPAVAVKNNIIVRNRNFDPAGRIFMLNAHIDTVPANEDYSFDPCKPDYEKVREIFGSGKEDIVCGLGSNDDGGSVVSLCSVFRHFYDKDLPCSLLLVLSCEEERSGPDGMTWIWEHYNEIPGLETASRPSWAIVGEPTGMKAATSERGLLVIDAEAEGVSGHAANGEGVTALYIALDDIMRLRNYEFGKVSPAMGKVRLNVTQIEAGTAHNVIPDKCRFTVDIRPTEMYGNQEILDSLQAVCKSRLRARNLRNRSSATRPGSPLTECVRALGIETYSSPTTSDWLRIDCDAVKMGPGESARSHKKDEYITIREISEGISGYMSFLSEFFSIIGKHPDSFRTK